MARTKITKETNYVSHIECNPSNIYEFQVQSFEMVATIDLNMRTCMCHKFQLDQYLYMHTIIICKYQSISMYNLCDIYYSLDK